MHSLTISEPSKNVGRDHDAPDRWAAVDDRLRQAVSLLVEAASKHVHYIAPWDDSCAVDSPRLLGCDVYSALQTETHTDDGFGQWTVLLVLRANGHTVTMNEGSCTTEPVAGDLLLFDLHREHVLDLPPHACPADEHAWLTPAHLETLCRDYPFVCAHLDLDVRPTREQAEAMMLARLAPALAARDAPALRCQENGTRATMPVAA